MSEQPSSNRDHEGSCCVGGGGGEEQGIAKVTLPSLPTGSMPRKQARIHATGDASIMEGLDAKDRARVLRESMIERKEKRCSKTRCSRCWFPVDCGGTSYCVCSKMPPLAFRRETKFLIYMHPRDWYNAGDDAKILLSAAPDSSEIFVFGRPGDDEKLKISLRSCSSALLLFPDASAVSVDEFRDSYGQTDTSAAGKMAVVVLDGTWNNVKQMQKHFSKTVAPHVPHVKLEPRSLSVYARTQTRKDGISSVEAVALLLRELGDAPEMCDELVRYVTINNEALRLKPEKCDAGSDCESPE